MMIKDFLVYFFHKPILVTLFSVQLLPYIVLAWSGLVACFGLLQKKKAPAGITVYNKFAVIISAHNEEKSLPALLQGINAEKYPRGYFHIFVLADHCTDRTVEVTKSFHNVSLSILETRSYRAIAVQQVLSSHRSHPGMQSTGCFIIFFLNTQEKSSVFLRLSQEQVLS